MYINKYMSFEKNIQQWVLIDNEMRTLNDKLKSLREKKHELTDNINNHIEGTNLSNATIKISDGQLKFVKVKETQPLTFKYLETCLHEIIKNEEQVEKIIDYIKNKRETKSVSEIKRLYNN
jgi:predicted transcriptional regulator